jgi:hypothetical protein
MSDANPRRFVVENVSNCTMELDVALKMVLTQVQRDILWCRSGNTSSPPSPPTASLLVAPFPDLSFFVYLLIFRLTLEPQKRDYLMFEESI